jgi:5-methyltetrahydropteroyltriglutamate--homocysteine methyltransferase
MASECRADHVGSLLRPAQLLHARASAAKQQLQEIEDECIIEVIRRQKEIGLDVLTDGELRRRNFMSDFVDAVAGFDTENALARIWSGHGRSGSVSSVTGIVTSKLRRSLRLPDTRSRFCKTTLPGSSKSPCPARLNFLRFPTSVELLTRSIRPLPNCYGTSSRS